MSPDHPRRRSPRRSEVELARSRKAGRFPSTAATIDPGLTTPPRAGPPPPAHRPCPTDSPLPHQRTAVAPEGAAFKQRLLVPRRDRRELFDSTTRSVQVVAGEGDVD